MGDTGMVGADSDDEGEGRVTEDDDDGAAVVATRGASVADAHGGAGTVNCDDDDDDDDDDERGGADVSRASVCEAVTAMEEGGFNEVTPEGGGF